MDNENLYDENERVQSQSPTPKVQGIQGIQGVDTVTGVSQVSSGTNLNLGAHKSENYLTKTTPTTKEVEDQAKEEGELQFTTGVVRAADSPEAEEFLSSKRLYEKTLGVTEYDELRAKLNLRDDESFTDYYNRTHYIPKGFEIAAKLLLAEEKRKKLYTEVEAGNMSEEDFLYEAYGKDLLKQQGVDFSSSLYWYNKFKQGDYDDPRKNNTFMLQLIEQARDIFHAEKWYESIQTTSLADSLAKYVTGEVLPTQAVAEIFGEAFKQMTEYFDNAEQVVKYYRAGMLQGFDPTIDANGDGKIDYYYSTDGKLYNVNETGQGANTMKAYYNSDGSLNRIVQSDSYLGEVASETVKGFLSFFTGVADLVGLVGGLIWDLGEGIFTGDWDLSATTEVNSSMQQFWNTTWLGNHDYVTSSGFKNSDGSTNWAGIGRQGGRLVGTIAAFVATMGIGAAVGGISTAGSEAAGTAAKQGVGAAIKKGALKLTKGIANTAVKLTGYANGVGVGSSGTIGAILGNAATTAMKDAMNGAVTLTVNKKVLAAQGITDHELTDGEIFGKALASFGVEFVAGVALRSAVGSQAIDRFAGIAKGVKEGSITGLKSLMSYSPQLLKVTTESLKGRIAIGMGNMAMDAVENVFSSWVQTSYATKGKVLDINTLGQVLNSPSLWMNIAYQTKLNFKDNFSITTQDIVGATTDVSELIASTKSILNDAYKNATDPDIAASLKNAMRQVDADLAAAGPSLEGKLKAFEKISQELGFIESAEGFKPSYNLDKKSAETLKGLKANPITENIQKCFDKISSIQTEYTAACIEYINEVYAKQVEASKNIFKKAGFKFLYGKDMQDASIKMMQIYQAKLGNSELAAEWEASINDSFSRTKLFANNIEELGAEGAEALKYIDDGQIVMGKIVKDQDGKIKIEDSLLQHLKDSGQEAEADKLIEYFKQKDAQGDINGAMSDIFILTTNKGTQADGDVNRLNAIKNLDVIYRLFNLVEGEDNPYIQKYGDAFVIKFNGLGEQLHTVEQVRGMLQALTAMRMSVYDDKVLSSENSGKYMRILLSYFTQSQAEADEVLATRNGLNASVQVIDMLLKDSLITYPQAAKLIKALNLYLAEHNNEAGLKSLPTGDALLKIGQTNDYATAVKMLDAIEKIDKAREITKQIISYQGDEARQFKKYKQLTSAERQAFDDVKNLFQNDPTFQDLCLKNKIITKNTLEGLNSFQQGIRDKESGLQLKGSVISSEVSEEAKIDVLKYIEDILKGDSSDVSNKTEITLRFNDQDVDTIFGKLSSWGTFIKYLDSNKNSSDLAKQIKGMVDKKKSIGSLITLENFIKEQEQKGVTIDNNGFNQLRNRYKDFLADAIPQILDSKKLKVDKQAFYTEFFKDLGNPYSTDKPNRLSKSFIDFATMQETYGDNILTIGQVSKWVKDHAVPEGFSDYYRILTNNFRELNEDTVVINNDLVVIRLNDLMGPEMQKAFKKASNPETAARLIGKEDTQIIKELFSGTSFSKFQKEFNNIQRYISLYGDEIVLPADKVKVLLDKVGISFAGNIGYTGYQTKIPGIYYANGQQGISLGSKLNLPKLIEAATKENNDLRKYTKIIFQDPITKMDAFVGGINLVSPDTVTHYKDITLAPEITEELYTVKKLEVLASSNKIGKAASMTKEVANAYDSFATSTEYNDEFRMAMYMHNIIEALNKYSDTTDDKISRSPLVIIANKDVSKDYNKLWNVNVEKVDELYKLTITPKKFDEGTSFAEEAYKLINKNGLNSDTIKAIIPTNYSDDDLNPRTTTVLKEGLGNQTLNISHTPAAYISEFLLQNFDRSDDYFINNILRFDKDYKFDISTKKYEDALKIMDGLKRQEIRELEDDNIFLKIQQHYIDHEDKVLDLLCKKLETYYDVPANAKNLRELIFSEDMRRDIGQAIRLIITENDEVNPKYLDKNNNLAITNDLLTDIRSRLKGNKSEALADDEALKGFLSILYLASTSKVSYDMPEETLIQKLRAAVLAGTSAASDEIVISLMDLYSMSDAELKALNPLLKELGLKQIPQKKLDLIMESELRKMPKPDTPTSFAIEQSEREEPTFDPARGFIISNDDIGKNNIDISKTYIDKMIERKKYTDRGDLFRKIAVFNNDANLDFLNLNRRLLEFSKSENGVLNYIPYKSSLTRANFQFKELTWRFLDNISTFGAELQETGFFNAEAAAKVALNVYDLSSGTEYQGVHPDYLLVNKSGDVVNIASSNFSNGEFNYDNLVSAILKSGNNVDDIGIIHLNRNSLNTAYNASTAGVEFYRLSDNIEIIAGIINARMNNIADRYGLNRSQGAEIIQRTSQYYASQEMRTPKYWNDQLISQASKIGIDTEVIRDYITSTENYRFDNKYLNLFTQSMKSILEDSIEDELTNFSLQQIRDIQSFGQTKNTFLKIEGVEQAIDEANKTIGDTFKYITEENNSKITALVDSYLKDPEAGAEFIKSYIKNNNIDNPEEFTKELIELYAINDDSIAASLFKISGKSMQEFKDTGNTSVDLFKVINNKVDKVNTISLDEIQTRNKLTLDIEQFYNRIPGQEREHVYQIAYDYNGKEGTVYLRQGINSYEDLETTYKSFFEDYGKNEGTRTSIEELLKHTGNEGVEEFINTIKQAVADNALLIGYNSNAFDIPKLLSAPNLKGYDLSGLTKLDCLDVYELAKRLPTTDNIDIFNGKLKLSELSKNYDLDIDQAHNGIYDVRNTKTVLDNLLNNAIKQDKHYTKFFDTAEDMFKAVTGQDLDLSQVRFGKEANIAKIKEIIKYAGDPQKLYNFSTIINTLNEKAMSDAFNIRRKELDTNIRTHNLKQYIEFAEYISKGNNNQAAIRALEFLYENIISRKDLMKQGQDRFEIMANALKDSVKAKFLNSTKALELFKNIDELENTVLKITGKTTEDLLNFKETGILKQVLDTDLHDITADYLEQKRAAFYMQEATKPLTDLIEDNLSHINNIAKEKIEEHIKQSVLRMMDFEEDADGNLKIKRINKPEALNMLSKMQNEIIDVLKESPLLRANYDSIYELAQTTYNKLTLADGTQERPRNDTIYMTQANFSRLMDNMDLDISTISDYYGYNNEVYIPVLRHPRDIADSLHFMKVKIIKPDQGFDVVMNIDTMKTRFNGDFDGDHLTILKPQKFLSEYATVVNKFKNATGNILDEVLDTIISAPNFKSFEINDYKILSNPILEEAIIKDIETLNKYSTNIEETYAKLKEAFITNQKYIDICTKAGIENPKEFLEDIYCVEPIKIKSTTKADDNGNAQTYITYSDFMGLHTNELNRLAKDTYTRNSIAQAITLSKFDSISGMYQKYKITADMTEFNDQFNLINRAFTMSPTTRKIINSNIDSIKSALLNTDIKNVEGAADIIKTAANAIDIELGLRVYQIEKNTMMEHDPEFINTFNTIKNNYAKDKLIKALDIYSNGNEGSFENNLSKFIYNLDDITKLTKQTRSGVMYKSDKDSLQYLLNYASNTYSKGIIKGAEADNVLASMTKPLTNLIVLDSSVIKDNIIAEDGFLLFDKINDYSVLQPKFQKLNKTDADYIIRKYINKGIQEVTNDSKLYKIFGLTPNDKYSLLVGPSDEGVFSVYKRFGLDTTKTGSRGWKKTKGVPQGYVNTKGLGNLASVSDDCHILRDATWLDPKDVLSTFRVDTEYKCYDTNGVELTHEIGQIPAGTVAIKCNMDTACLEPTSTWNKAVSNTTMDPMDFGNSVIDTGGLWQSKFAFVDYKDGKLTFDNEAHRSMLKKVMDLSNPDAISHNAKGPYELLKLCVLSKYVTPEMLADNNCNSIEEFLVKCIQMPEGSLGSKLKALMQQVKPEEITNDIEYKLLYDNDLYDSIYGSTRKTADIKNTKATKGSNRRTTVEQSRFSENVEAGGGLEPMNIFTKQPNMSTLDLINYLNNKSTINESTVQRLMEAGLLPVGGYRKPQPDYSNISTSSAKIGETIATIQQDVKGDRIPVDDPLKFNQIDKYNSYNTQTDYINLKNSPILKNDGYLRENSYELALIAKALYPDLDKQFNKYTVLDKLSTGTNRYLFSFDPTQLQWKDGNIEYLPKQYISHEEQQVPIRGDQVLDKLYQMRSSPLYHTNLEEASEQLVDPLRTYSIKPKASSEYNLDNLVSGFAQTESKLNYEQQAALESFKTFATTPEELSKKLETQPLVYGGKIVDQHKVFSEEKIMWNHGIKIKDSDDLIQDRNLKQTAIDSINYTNEYSKDVIALYNYSQNNNSSEAVNTYAYLLAAQLKLNKQPKYSKDINKDIDTQNIISSLKDFGITSPQDLEIKLKTLEQTHKTETYFVNKILINLKADAEKYSKLLDQPFDTMFITKNATANKNARKSIFANLTNRLKHETQTNAPIEDGLPIYDSYNFIDSISTTIQQIAKQKAFYENSIRLRKSGVIDNTKIHSLLSEVLQENRVTIENMEPTPEYRESIQSLLNNIIEKLGIYLDSNDDDTGLYNRILNIDADLSDGNFKQFGKSAMQLFDILSEVASNSKMSYDTAKIDNSEDADRFIALVDVTQDLFATISGLTHDSLAKSLVNKISTYAQKNNLSIVDARGKLLDTEKILMLNDLDIKSIMENAEYAIENKELGRIHRLADRIIRGDAYLMDSALANAYAKTFFKEYKDPGKLMSFIRKSSNLCIKLIMSSPFKLVDRFLKFSAFDASTLGTANIDTFKYEGQSFKDLKAYFQSRGAYASQDLSEFLQTQGIKMRGDNFDLLLNMENADGYNLFKGYTDATGRWFTFQTLSQRYAYWLATKESLKNGDYSVLGSAYHLRDAIKDMEAVTDSNGETRVSKEGQQAAFAMAQMIGSPNDFPGMSRTLSKYGFVFTTFPLAAARWGIGELRSMASAVKGLFSEGITSSNTKWLLRQSSGILATFIAEQLLVNLLADMFGVGDDEEQKNKWKRVGALPNVTQTLIQGQPIMDTFSSANIAREFYGLTLEPFIEGSDDSALSGFQRFLYKNIISHTNPVIKNIGEVVAKKDLIDDQIIDTSEKYSALENVYRKMSSYILGGAGSNALAKQLHEHGYSADSFSKGLKNAISAELGNTKAQKENQKNYYNMLSLVNSYKDYSESNYSQSTNFNFENYSEVKSEIYKLINAKASATDVYSKISELTKKGYTYQEVRAAIKNCSLSNKLNSISDYKEFLNALNPSEIQNIKTALAYEEYMFPWIEEEIENMNSLIRNAQSSSGSFGYANLYNLKPKYTNYGAYTQPNYTLPNANQNYNYNNYNYNPYQQYLQDQQQQAYNKRQAEYKRNQQKYGGN